MSLVVSSILLVVGAVLWFAVTVEVDWIDLDVVGLVLFLVGAVGLVWSGLSLARGGGFTVERRRRPR